MYTQCSNILKTFSYILEGILKDKYTMFWVEKLRKSYFIHHRSNKLDRFHLIVANSKSDFVSRKKTIRTKTNSPLTKHLRLFSGQLSYSVGGKHKEERCLFFCLKGNGVECLICKTLKKPSDRTVFDMLWRGM